MAAVASERRLWAVAAAAVLHVLEEYLLDWVGYTRAVSGIVVTWPQFWTANAAFIVIAVAAAAVGWRAPVLALGLPALVLINGLVFHIAPTVALGRVSPGVFTSALLYLPLGAWAYAGARRDGVLTGRVALLSAALGAALMALPLAVFARR
jgi:hypothetical protein